MSDFRPAGPAAPLLQLTVHAEIHLGVSPPVRFSGPAASPHNREPVAMAEPARPLRLFTPEADPESQGQRIKGTGLGIRYPSPTLGEIWAAFESRLSRLIAQGERSGRTLADYRLAARHLLDVLGAGRRLSELRPADFACLRAAMAQNLGKKTLSKRIMLIRTILRAAGDLRDEAGNVRWTGRPDYGREFDRPSNKALRRERQQKPARAFDPAEIRRLLEHAREPLRTMVLLAINGGLGNTDVAELCWGAVDLSAPAWLDYPRPKTAVDRRIPLWRRTAAALQEMLGLFPAADPQERLFTTHRGNPWVRVDATGKHADAIAKQFGKLRRRAEIDKPVGFYGLRHSFQTLGEESGDPQAVGAIMGHVDHSMASVYRERISDARLLAVAETVHAQIFG